MFSMFGLASITGMTDDFLVTATRAQCYHDNIYTTSSGITLFMNRPHTCLMAYDDTLLFDSSDVRGGGDLLARRIPLCNGHFWEFTRVYNMVSIA